MNRSLRFAPLVVLVVVIALLAWRLAEPADTKIRSRLAGAAVPSFALPAAIPGKAGLSSADFTTGKPRLLNIFASWCVPCITEVRVLQGLAQRGIAVDGIAVRDRSDDVAGFLRRYGDPYARIGGDPQSAVQIALGSSGVPESFVIDGRGIIRYQHIGPIEADDVPTILAELDKAR